MLYLPHPTHSSLPLHNVLGISASLRPWLLSHVHPPPPPLLPLPSVLGISVSVRPRLFSDVHPPPPPPPPPLPLASALGISTSLRPWLFSHVDFFFVCSHCSPSSVQFPRYFVAGCWLFPDVHLLSQLPYPLSDLMSLQCLATQKR